MDTGHGEERGQQLRVGCSALGVPMSSAWWTRWASVCRVSLPARYLILASHSFPNSSLVALTHSAASPRTSYPNVHTATGYCHRVPHQDDAQCTQQPLVD